MNRRLILLLLFSKLFIVEVFANKKAIDKKVNVRIRVEEADTRKITPAMVCIIRLSDSSVLVPPHGEVAGEPSDPSPFFEGIDFEESREWHGPIRKMNGMGAINGQRTYVYGMKPSIPHWKEPVMYQTTGDFVIELLPGSYSISIQHGMEYIPVKEMLLISDEKKISKTYRLKRWVNLPRSGWYSGDVHAHHPVAKPSFKEYMLQMAKAENLHVVNMLEMGDRWRTYFHAEGFGEKYRICREDNCLVFGQEEPRSDFGHIIALNIAELVRDTSRYNYYDLVFEKVKSSPGALVGFAHFAYGGEGVKKGLPLYITTGNVDFVELMQNSQLNLTDYHTYLNMGFQLSAASGSDFPWGSTIGDGRTYVYTGKQFSADAWFSGLKQGNSFVSNGPVLLMKGDGAIPGKEIHKKKGAKITINVQAMSHPGIGTLDRVELYNNDGLLAVVENHKKKKKIRLKVKHILGKSEWFAAAAYADNGALAHTSPLYCIVENAPTWSPEKAPLLILNQMKTLDMIVEEEKEKDIPDIGIIERVEKARVFYNDMLERLK